MAFFCLVGRCQRQGLARPTTSHPATPRRMARSHPWPVGCGTADSARLLGRSVPTPRVFWRRWRRIQRRLVEGETANPAPVPPPASARGWPYHGRRPRRPAKPGGRKRRRRGVSGGHGWPTRMSGDVVRSTPSLASPRPRSRPPAYAATDQAAARVTGTTAAASCSPSPDRGDRTGTSCPDPRAPPHGSGTRTAP